METENLINEQLAAMDLSQLEELLGAVEAQGGLFSGISLRQVLTALVRGEAVFTWDQVLVPLRDFFFAQIQSSLTVAVEIFAVCILIGLLENMASSFGRQGASRLGSLVCGMVVIVLCMADFENLYQLCGDSVGLMVRAMQVLLPILIPLLLAMGGVTAGTLLNPAVMSGIAVLSTVIKSAVLPAVFVSCVFFMVNMMTEKEYIKKLAQFLRGAAVFGMGLSMSLFSALVSLQGLAAKTTDGMLFKTAQYSIDNFIPIIGGFAADSLDLIRSCTGVIRNGVGIVGFLVLITLMSVPVIKLLAAAVIYKVLAALLEPVAGRRTADCIDSVGTGVIILSVILILTGILFIIFLAILLSMGKAV